MNDLQATAIGGKLLFTFDWTDAVPGSVTVTQIDYVLPAGITSFADVDDLDNKKGTVGLEGFAHGATQLIRAEATLSNGEKIGKTLTVRGFNG